MKKLFFIILCCFLFPGCAVVSDLNLINTGEEPIQISEKQRQKFENAEQLIGRTKQDVINQFGTNIRYSTKSKLAINVPDHPNLHPFLEKRLVSASGIIKYFDIDEVGYYRYDAGVPLIMPQQYAINFYFIDNICVFVTAY